MNRLSIWSKISSPPENSTSLKGVGFDCLLHIVTRRIRQHVLSSARSQEAQLLELGTRWKILLIRGCSGGLQFSGVQ